MPTIEEIKIIATLLGKQYGVERIFLFGSYARGDNNEESDIDLRIDKGNIRGLFQLCAFQNQLKDMLGKEVHVLTTESIDKQILNIIAKEEILIYANGDIVKCEKDKVYTQDELIEMIKPILKRYNSTEAILFGSYARNEATASSDIDLMVMGGQDFDSTDIFAIADDLFKASGKNVDVYEQSEISKDSKLLQKIISEGVTI